MSLSSSEVETFCGQFCPPLRCQARYPLYALHDAACQDPRLKPSLYSARHGKVQEGITLFFGSTKNQPNGVVLHDYHDW